MRKGVKKKQKMKLVQNFLFRLYYFNIIEVYKSFVRVGKIKKIYDKFTNSMYRERLLAERAPWDRVWAVASSHRDVPITQPMLCNIK